MQKAEEKFNKHTAETEARIQELEARHCSLEYLTGEFADLLIDCYSQEQVRDLMFFIDAKKKIEDSNEVPQTLLSSSCSAN